MLQHSGGDRSALAAASRDLRYWSARRATARVLPSPTDTTEARFSASARRTAGQRDVHRSTLLYRPRNLL